MTLAPWSATILAAAPPTALLTIVLLAALKAVLVKGEERPVLRRRVRRAGVAFAIVRRRAGVRFVVVFRVVLRVAIRLIDLGQDRQGQGLPVFLIF